MNAFFPDFSFYKNQSILFGSIDEKPVVECSFITEFEDHIFVTVDADAFFFLHDLITSYLKEKEKVVRTGLPHLNIRSASITHFNERFYSIQIGSQNMRSASPNPSFSGTSLNQSQSDQQKPDSPPAPTHDSMREGTPTDSNHTANNAASMPSTSSASAATRKNSLK